MGFGCPVDRSDGQKGHSSLNQQHSRSCLQSHSRCSQCFHLIPKPLALNQHISQTTAYTSLSSFCLLELFTMGVKALQKRLSATVFMKAGISEPALIGFNAVLPACLSRNEIPRGL